MDRWGNKQLFVCSNLWQIIVQRYSVECGARWYRSGHDDHEMIEMFTKENVMMLNQGEIKHWILRARSHNQTFEISTLRIDAADRGKRENDENWKLDAQTIPCLWICFDLQTKHGALQWNARDLCWATSSSIWSFRWPILILILICQFSFKRITTESFAISFSALTSHFNQIWTRLRSFKKMLKGSLRSSVNVFEWNWRNFIKDAVNIINWKCYIVHSMQDFQRKSLLTSFKKCGPGLKILNKNWTTYLCWLRCSIPPKRWNWFNLTKFKIWLWF